MNEYVTREELAAVAQRITNRFAEVQRRLEQLERECCCIERESVDRTHATTQGITRHEDR